MSDLWPYIAQQRRELADRFETFADEQWSTPSYCAGWSTKVCAAHLTMPLVTKTPKVMWEMVRAMGDFNKANDKLSRALGAQPAATIVANLRAHAEHQFTPPGLGPEAPLSDLLVHGQDICRPLGIDHQVPEAPLRVSLDNLATPKFKKFVGAERVDGLAFRATDIDWAMGEGAEVSGPAMSILIAVWGRKAAVGDLSGDGAARLA